MTLSFSLLTLFIHGLHFSKPKDVECPINFHHKQVLLRANFEGSESLSYAHMVPSRSVGRCFDTFDPGLNVPNDIFREGDGRLFLLTTTSSTFLFGTTHCIAWQFSFPTIEQWTWRACALAGIILPFVMLVVPWIGSRNLRVLDHRRDSAEVEHAIVSNQFRTEFKRVLADRGLHSSVLGTFIGDYEVEYTTNTMTRFVHKIGGLRKQIPKELYPLLKKLYGRAKRVDNAHSAREKFLRHRVYYQYPAIPILLLTQITIIVIAFTSFWKAPRRIYKGTWTSFWPTFQ